jgi:drug/metabolite transporter (DMT)-like permease
MFFAMSFIMNRAMELSGGNWIWSAALRYFFMLPFLVVLVVVRGNLKVLIIHMRQQLFQWIIWSTIGFGLFYAPLCFSAAYGPSWLVASMWQLTIITGTLLVPFFYKESEVNGQFIKYRQKIPIKGLLFSAIILLGIAVIQIEQMNTLSLKELLFGIFPVVIAAFSYPLGNRKMMEVCNHQLDTFQRVLGMTIASMPFWIVLAIIGFARVGAPSVSQMSQSIIVAVSSGVIATLLFFSATDLAKGEVHKLAAIEATQAGEVIFALMGEIFILKGVLPSGFSIVGMIIVIIGMILHSFATNSRKEKKEIFFE